MKKSILTTIAFVLFVFAARAQSTTVSATTTPQSFSQKVNLNALPVITDGGGGGGATTLNEITFDFDTDAEYTNGISNVQAHNFKINATSNWTVNVKTLTQYFAATNLPIANGTSVAANKLSWSVDNGANYTTMSTTDVLLKSGGVGAATLEANQFDVMYKMDPGYIPQDSYSITVLYTLTAQ